MLQATPVEPKNLVTNVLFFLYKNQEYIWFMGGCLKKYQKSILRREGVGHAPEVSVGIRDPCSSRAGHSLY